jgi:hypothetical protein
MAEHVTSVCVLVWMCYISVVIFFQACLMSVCSFKENLWRSRTGFILYYFLCSFMLRSDVSVSCTLFLLKIFMYILNLATTAAGIKCTYIPQSSFSIFVSLHFLSAEFYQTH